MIENELGEKRYLIWGWLSVTKEGLLSLTTRALSHTEMCVLAHSFRSYSYVTGMVSQA
jgi:hypothetical protein